MESIDVDRSTVERVIDHLRGLCVILEQLEADAAAGTAHPHVLEAVDRLANGPRSPLNTDVWGPLRYGEETGYTYVSEQVRETLKTLEQA